MIEIKNFSKKYRRWIFNWKKIDLKKIETEVYKNFNLKIGKGINFLIGNNGIGKTTLLNCIIGYTRYEGYIEKNDLKISYLPEIRAFLGDLKVKEMMKLTKDSGAYEEIDEYAKMLKFDITQDKSIDELSKGNKSKLYLLTILQKKSDLYVLDEPTDGMDIGSKDEFLKLLELLKLKGKNVIISTHDIGIIKKKIGKIINLNEMKLIC